MLDTPTKPYDEEAVSNQMDAAQSAVLAINFGNRTIRSEILEISEPVIVDRKSSADGSTVFTCRREGVTPFVNVQVAKLPQADGAFLLSYEVLSGEVVSLELIRRIVRTVDGSTRDGVVGPTKSAAIVVSRNNADSPDVRRASAGLRNTLHAAGYRPHTGAFADWLLADGYRTIVNQAIQNVDREPSPEVAARMTAEMRDKLNKVFTLQHRGALEPFLTEGPTLRIAPDADRTQVAEFLATTFLAGGPSFRSVIDNNKMIDYGTVARSVYPGHIWRLLDAAPTVATVATPAAVNRDRGSVAAAPPRVSKPSVSTDQGGRKAMIVLGAAAAVAAGAIGYRVFGPEPEAKIVTVEAAAPPPEIQEKVVEVAPAVDPVDLVDGTSGGYWILGPDGKLFEGNGAGAFQAQTTFADGVVAVAGAALPDGSGVFILGSDATVVSAGAAPVIARDAQTLLAPNGDAFPVLADWKLPADWNVLRFLATPSGLGYVVEFDNGLIMAGGDGADVVRYIRAMSLPASL